MTQTSAKGLFGVVGLGISYFLLLNLFSTVAIVVDIWLSIKGQLGGNAAATIISSVIVIKMSRGLLNLSNKHVVAPFAAIAGLSSLAFLAFLHAISGTLENYDFPPITALQAVMVIAFNAIILLRQSSSWIVGHKKTLLEGRLPWLPAPSLLPTG